MAEQPKTTRFLFPRWSNFAAPAGAVGVVGGLVYATVLFAFGASPKTTAVNYAPTQPVPYSHALHVGKLGLDCRYCHNTVERTEFAALPATQTCMNCHTNIKPSSPGLQPVRDSWTTGRPVEWVKVHDLPDYVYFNHSAHVSHGVGCVECHGRIDHMEVVHQAQPLSMGWCLDCHRDPAPHLRPKTVAVTDMHWDGSTLSGAERDTLKQQYGIHDAGYMTSCSTCHR
jgi:hypothetical protein